MKQLIAVTLAVTMLAAAVFAQKRTDSPTDVVLSFYSALKQKRYVEGFRHSIYRGAVEGLSQVELNDLEEDFARTFSAIPDTIEARGEQITGSTATVFLKFDGIDKLQPVALLKVGTEWLVGDEDSLAIVKKQGRSFFFNARIRTNEDEAADMLKRVIGVEWIYSQKAGGLYATLQELIRLGGLPKDIEGGESNGYRFVLTVSENGKSFFITATPDIYGKTGQLSFYADLNGVRAEDLKGQVASAKSPVHQPR